jgi:hypothetical protein
VLGMGSQLLHHEQSHELVHHKWMGNQSVALEQNEQHMVQAVCLAQLLPLQLVRNTAQDHEYTYLVSSKSFLRLCRTRCTCFLAAASAAASAPPAAPAAAFVRPLPEPLAEEPLWSSCGGVCWRCACTSASSTACIISDLSRATSLKGFL